MSEWKELLTISEVAKAVAEGMDIEWQYFNDSWFPWCGTEWGSDRFYRARPKPPKPVKVKSLCWRHPNGKLAWASDENATIVGYARFPAGDIEGEIS